MVGGGDKDIEAGRPGDRLVFMSEVLRSFADATTDYPRLLETIAEKSASFFGHYCSLRLLSEGGGRLVTAAMCDPTSAISTSIAPFAAQPLEVAGSAVLRDALERKRGVLMVELPRDELTLPFEPSLREAARNLDIRSVIVLPLAARGATLGALFVLQRGDSPPLAQADLEVGDLIAAHAALAIANARMMTELTREVTERKRIQDTLATVESARLHEKSIVDTISQPLVVLDGNRCIRDANRNFHEVFGTTDAEVVGRRFDEVADGALASPRMTALLAEVLPVRTGVFVTDVEVDVTTPHLGHRAMLVNARKMFRPGNGTDSLLLVLDDITERKDAAEKLQRRALLLESMSEAVIAGDLDFRVEEWNPAAERLFGWSADEVRGKPIEQFLDVREIDRQGVRADVRAGITKRLRGRIRHRGGHWLEIELSSMPVKAEGSVIGFVAVMQDVTARWRLERDAEQRLAELQAANRELESFSYSVSHDLRAPVRAIAGFARLLYEDHGKVLDEEALRLLAVVRKNAQKMGVLIDDLLDFSRMGRQAISLEELDMNELARDVLDEARLAEAERTFELRIAPLPSVEGDRVLIGQVWENLLTNAVKYTRGREPAVIEISAEATESEITYHVKDNGVGFDIRFADKVFKVFERLHVATEFEGTGVGLALVDRIIRRHGGRVWADAKIDGGATFHFSLPRGIVRK